MISTVKLGAAAVSRGLRRYTPRCHSVLPARFTRTLYRVSTTSAAVTFCRYLKALCTCSQAWTPQTAQTGVDPEQALQILGCVHPGTCTTAMAKPQHT